MTKQDNNFRKLNLALAVYGKFTVKLKEFGKEKSIVIDGEKLEFTQRSGRKHTLAKGMAFSSRTSMLRWMGESLSKRNITAIHSA